MSSTPSANCDARPRRRSNRSVGGCSIRPSKTPFDRVLVDVTDERAKPYLDAVQEDLEEKFEVFVSDDEETGVDRFIRWRVNLAVDNSDLDGRPVVMETEPTYTNLFGTIERTMLPSGETTTSFMRISAGSMLRANGGYLVVNAEDILMEPRVWPGHQARTAVSSSPDPGMGER